MIRIAVIDDDPVFCKELKNQILKTDDVYEVSCYSSMDEFYHNAADFSIAVIDVMLDKENGIDKAAAIASAFPMLNIIFVSAERDFFQDVYNVEHTYFMVKPVSDSELNRALKLCRKNLERTQLSVKQQSGTVVIELNKVLYFEGMLKKTLVHYADCAEQLLNIPLKDIEQQLRNDNFIRTHQSFIVNMNYINRASKNKIIIQNTEIPISRKYSGAAAAILRYLSENMLGGSAVNPLPK